VDPVIDPVLERAFLPNTGDKQVAAGPQPAVHAASHALHAPCTAVGLLWF